MFSILEKKLNKCVKTYKIMDENYSEKNTLKTGFEEQNK